MNSKFLKGLGIVLLSASLGHIILILPISNKRITAFIALLLFTVLGYFIFKQVKSFKHNTLFVLNSLWMLLFPVPYVITHPWSLTVLLTLFACLMGLFIGLQTSNNVNTLKTKFIYIVSVIIIFSFVNIWLYPYVFDFGISLAKI